MLVRALRYLGCTQRHKGHEGDTLNTSRVDAKSLIAQARADTIGRRQSLQACGTEKDSETRH